MLISWLVYVWVGLCININYKNFVLIFFIFFLIGIIIFVGFLMSLLVFLVINFYVNDVLFWYIDYVFVIVCSVFLYLFVIRFVEFFVLDY